MFYYIFPEVEAIFKSVQIFLDVSDQLDFPKRLRQNSYFCAICYNESCIIIIFNCYLYAVCIIT